jgi:urease gamma subunit
MILNELAQVAPERQVAKIFEQYFGKQIDVAAIKPWQAQHMLTKVRRTIAEHRASPAFHQSERNASYLKLLMMEQALSQHFEGVAGVGDGAATDVAGQGPAIAKNSAGLSARAAAKSQQGQKLTRDEATALGESINRIQRMMGRRLTESEVQQAQVVLAAQDIIDSIQKMIEDMTAVQFKELPALVDSIRNQVGTAEADQYNSAATAALGGLVQNLQGAKQQLEQAQGILTGQGVPTDTSMGAAAGDLETPTAPGSDADLFAEPTEPETPKTAGLGRERR